MMNIKVHRGLEQIGGALLKSVLQPHVSLLILDRTYPAMVKQQHPNKTG